MLFNLFLSTFFGGTYAGKNLEVIPLLFSHSLRFFETEIIVNLFALDKKNKAKYLLNLLYANNLSECIVIIILSLLIQEKKKK